MCSGHGEIGLSNYGNNESHEWQINAECDTVKVKSSHFDIEQDFDFLIIDGTKYTGKTPIKQTVEKKSFVVSFTSDHNNTNLGFSLQWKCKGKSLGYLLH